MNASNTIKAPAKRPRATAVCNTVTDTGPLCSRLQTPVRADRPTCGQDHRARRPSTAADRACEPVDIGITGTPSESDRSPLDHRYVPPPTLTDPCDTSHRERIDGIRAVGSCSLFRADFEYRYWGRRRPAASVAVAATRSDAGFTHIRRRLDQCRRRHADVPRTGAVSHGANGASPAQVSECSDAVCFNEPSHAGRGGRARPSGCRRHGTPAGGPRTGTQRTGMSAGGGPPADISCAG